MNKHCGTSINPLYKYKSVAILNWDLNTIQMIRELIAFRYEQNALLINSS